MRTTDSEISPSSQLPDVPWDDVARFVRQLSHDLRNHLNATELQSAYIGEIATDPELKEEIKRLRGMLSGLGSVLQKISTDMAHARANRMPYKASDFMDDLRQKLESSSSKPEIEWEVQVGNAMLDVDVQLLPLAVQELLDNAARFSQNKPVKISAKIDDSGRFSLSLVETAERSGEVSQNWGREPLRNITQGHYGLGLNRARTIVESHGGRLEAHYDQSSRNLVTTITLPMSAESS